MRAIYAEETPEFINEFHEEGANGFDACVKGTVDNIGTSKFFKVETEDGVLLGFFTTDHIDGIDIMPSFHVRRIFRVPEYLQVFWNLIRDTFNNDFFTSVGTANYKALQHLLKNDFEVVNHLEYKGKDFAVLKTYHN